MEMSRMREDERLGQLLNKNEGLAKQEYKLRNQRSDLVNKRNQLDTQINKLLAKVKSRTIKLDNQEEFLKFRKDQFQKDYKKHTFTLNLFKLLTFKYWEKRTELLNEIKKNDRAIKEIPNQRDEMMSPIRAKENELRNQVSDLTAEIELVEIMYKDIMQEKKETTREINHLKGENPSVGSKMVVKEIEKAGAKKAVQNKAKPNKPFDQLKESAYQVAEASNQAGRSSQNKLRSRGE